MNKSRRKRIASVISILENIIDYDLIESAKDELEDILYEEEDAYDNMPENLQYSMRGEESSDAIDNLQEAVYNLEEALDSLNEIDNLDKNDDDYENRIEMEEDEIDSCVNNAISNLQNII